MDQNYTITRYLSFTGIIYFTHIFKTDHEVLSRVISRERRMKGHTYKVEEILQFPDDYHVKGVLSLPYGDVVEPFEAWHSPAHKMSRIDYYHGMSSKQVFECCVQCTFSFSFQLPRENSALRSCSTGNNIST